MLVKIRPFNNGWHKGSQYEWQPEPSANGKWYHVWSKNIVKFPYGDPELRRKVGVEIHFLMTALYQGLPVKVRARYNRENGKLYILEANGEALHS